MQLLPQFFRRPHLLRPKSKHLGTLPLHPQAGSIRKPLVFLPLANVPNLIPLELFCVAQLLIDQDPVLLLPHSPFNGTLPLGSFVACEMLPFVGDALLILPVHFLQLLSGILRIVHAEDNAHGRVTAVQGADTPVKAAVEPFIFRRTAASNEAVTAVGSNPVPGGKEDNLD